MYGNSAEWIVERPGDPLTQHYFYLADHAPAFFHDAVAASRSSDGQTGHELYPGGGGTIHMDVASGEERLMISQGFILTSDSLVADYVYPYERDPYPPGP